MPLYDARIQVVHDCPYSILTRKYPEATIAMWCNMHSHVFELSAPSEEVLKLVERELGNLGTKQVTVREGSLLSMITKDCDCKPGVGSIIEEEGLWHEEPVVYRGGWENYHVLGHEREAFGRMVKRIEREGGTVNLQSLRPLRLRGVAKDMILTTSTMFAGLTDKQIEVLALASALGYFDRPAKVGLDELARRSGLSRSTYAEHLRKAEGKLLDNLCPLIQMAANSDACRG
ncbi:MAG: helix-turn-helix domain-containing protein [Methanomassiliicoccales archaeon]|nr:helix-turn-helix domain-containing protein [Methanomassiliicoccales archaeon]